MSTVECKPLRHNTDESHPLNEIVFNAPEVIQSSSITSHFRKMFSNKKRCDVTIKFSDGSDPIKAHRIILSMTSEVLEKMLKDCDEVTVSDSKEQFSWLVDHAYTGDVQVTEDIHFWLKICSTLNKYKMYTAKKTILQRLRLFITERNLNDFYELNMAYEAGVKDKCKQVVHTHGWRMVSEAGKRNLAPTLISDILDLELIRISEEELFRILLGWAKMRIGSKLIEESGEKLRKEMEPFLKKIIFTKLDFHVFMREVVPLQIFTNEEVCSLLKNTHKSTNWKRNDDPLAPIFCYQHKRRCYNVTDISIYNMVKHPSCGPFAEFSNHAQQMLFTIMASEDIYINGINSKGCCYVGYFKIYVEDPSTRVTWKTGPGPMWRFANPFKIAAKTTYKFYVEGNGRIAKHKYNVYCGYPNNVEMYGEVSSCHVAIHFT